MTWLVSAPLGFATGFLSGIATNYAGYICGYGVKSIITGQDGIAEGKETGTGALITTAFIGKAAVLAATHFIGAGVFISSAKMGGLAATSCAGAIAGNHKNWKPGAVAGALAGGVTTLFSSATAGLAVGCAVGFGFARYVKLEIPSDFLEFYPAN